MKNPALKQLIFRTILAVVVGEVALILLTTVAQEVLYDGISYTHSPAKDLIFGGLATLTAGAIAGLIAGLIGGKTNFRPPVILSILIAVETTVLISTGKTVDPAWFDLLSGLALIGSVWAGYFLAQRLVNR